jgi:hypothetical protein
VLELQTVRGMLRDWSPPASELGFKIVQGHEPLSIASPNQPDAAGSWRWGRMSHAARWAQAAAAVLLFAAGMAVSQLQVDYSGGALRVRARSVAPAGPAARNVSIQLPASPETVDAVRPSVADRLEPEEMLQRVRAMIEQSEVRQQRELALRLSQVSREVDTQHRADLQRIQQNLGQFEMETGAQINQQQQQMDYLVRTSGGPK